MTDKKASEKTDGRDEKAANEDNLVSVHDLRPEDYDGTCLRPLGLCDLGGCCDTCWYRPDHPRFKDE